MKLPVFSSLRKMIQRLGKSEEQGKKDVCYREPSVLVTLYVVKHRGSHDTAARKPTGVRRRPRHRQEIRVQSAVSDGGGGGYNRREELLRHRRHLRKPVADQPPPSPPPHQCQRSPPRLHLPNEPQRHGQGKRLLEKMFTSLKKTKNVH